jgi:hypothetical protein
MQKFMILALNMATVVIVTGLLAKFLPLGILYTNRPKVW